MSMSMKKPTTKKVTITQVHVLEQKGTELATTTTMMETRIDEEETEAETDKDRKRDRETWR